MPSRDFVLRLCALAATLTSIGSTALAAPPAPVGKRALLSLNIQIDGAGQRTVKSDGTDVKWSTHRTLDATVELIAGDAQGKSAAADFKRDSAAAASYKPSANLEALQKEAQKCKPDDMECQMAIAMKVMETDEGKKAMNEDKTAQAAPPRYQTWKTPDRAGRVEVKGEYLEQWDAVFLTASRETRNCKIAYPSVSAAGGANQSAKNRETLTSGMKGINLEIDTQTGKNSLQLIVGSFVASELNCHINDGGRVSDERETRNLTFNPPIDLDTTGGWVAGSVATAPTIARGEWTFDTKAEAHSLTGMMSVTAPLKVKVRWELKPP